MLFSGLSCMSANCDTLAGEDFVLSHIGVENVRDMYNQLSFLDFVRSHPQLRFCPGNNCKLIIKAVLPMAKRVVCSSCKSSFWYLLAYFFWPLSSSSRYFFSASNVEATTMRRRIAKPSNAGLPNALTIAKRQITFQLIQKT